MKRVERMFQEMNETDGEQSTLISYIMYAGTRNVYPEGHKKVPQNIWYGCLKTTHDHYKLLPEWIEDKDFWDQEFIKKCKSNKNKWIPMEPGNAATPDEILQSPIAHLPTMKENTALGKQRWTPVLQGCNPVCMYQQSDDPSCVFNATSNVLSYFGDKKAAEHIDALSYTISSGINKLDKIMQDLRSLHGYQVFKLNSCIDGATLKCWLPQKIAHKNGDVVAILQSLPKVGQIEASDGTIGHSVGMMGCWIFDSNLTHAFPLSQVGLDWSSSTNTSKLSFVHFHRLYVFAKKQHTYNLRIPDNVQEDIDCEKYEVLFHEP